MSSTLGPPLALDGPLPVAPAHSLLAAASLVPSDSYRFGVGGVVWPYPPGLPQAWSPCSAGTFRVKSDASEWDLPEFESFELYLPITCSSITAHSEGFADRVALAFAATESYGVARELSRGAANPLNPFLTDANLVQLNGGTAVSADVGLSFLEEAIGATGRGGIIHATPAIGAAWNGSSGGYGVEVQGGRLLTTANGTPVALDGGYIGASPALHAPLTAGQGWAFATGPVQIRRGPDIEIIAEDIAQSMDRSNNEVTFRAERPYLVTWDTALQAGVLIDWTP